MPLLRVLLKPMALVFLVFGMTGFALSTLPLHVHHVLGQSTFIVGLVSGTQFAAALVSRLWSGHLCDRQGPTRAIRIGLIAASGSGLLYLLSLPAAVAPDLALGLLLVARGLMGGAESFLITGALAWGLTSVEPSRSGRVMAWIGTAMYAAYALGAPIGLLLYNRFGLLAIGVVTLVLPMLAFGLVRTAVQTPPPAPAQRARSSRDTWLAIWRPGLGLALSSIGFAAVTTFITLLYVDRGWLPSWAGFSAFAGAFVLIRLVGPHLPDRHGGPRVAFFSLLLEASGLAVVAWADAPEVATAGALLAGAGYSLVFPGFGIEVVRSAPEGNRALALGSYTACLDLALCVAGPVLGLLVSQAGLSSAFGASALAVASAMWVAWGLARRSPTTTAAAAAAATTRSQEPAP